MLKLPKEKWLEFCNQSFIAPQDTLELIYKEVIDLSNESLSFEQFKRALIYLAVTQLDIKEFTKDLSKNLPLEDLYNFLTIITGETPGEPPQSTAPFKRQSSRVSVGINSTARSGVKQSSVAVRLSERSGIKQSPIGVRSPAAQPQKVIPRVQTV